MELNLLVERRWKKADYTIGRWYVDGEYLTNSLEDTDRGLKSSMSPAEVKKVKVKGQTAIPTGRYPVVESYSGKFGKMMPEVLRVPGFSAIRIHPGNTNNDTEGCLLIGENKQKGMVLNSRYWFNILFGKIHATLTKGGKVWLTIK